jgi:ABC-type amino acid transport system permease subunit
VVALAFNAGAYNARAIRAGILAVHKGQTEAARSLGLTPFMTFRDVVFPQTFRISLPPLVINIVSLLKDASLAYMIGVVELSNIGNRIGFIWNPVKGADIGTEYIFGRRTTLADENGDMGRINLSAKYNFN